MANKFFIVGSNVGSGGGGTDSNAIHDNVNGEINAITNKAVPVGTDILLIEDASDSFSKKEILLSALPGGGDVSAAAVIADNAIVRGDGGSKGVQDSGVIISDTDEVTGVLDLTLTGDLTIPSDGLFGATNTNGMVWVGDGTNYNEVLMSGDASIASDGTITVVGGGVEAVIITAKVNEVAGVTKGDVVYLSGASGNLAQVSLASNDDFTKVGVIAMANETKTNNQNILITLLGEVENVDTSAFTEGDILFLGTGGATTATHPSGVIDAIVIVGQATKINASTGIISFKVSSHSLVDTFDGTVRQMIVNQSTGTSAVSSHTFVNDVDHRASISLSGSNNSQGTQAFSLFQQGYGTTFNLNDGNKGYEWWTDITDSHDGSFTKKMELNAAGDLILEESSDFKFGANAILSDTSGTMTLSNIDALDTTTQGTIHNLIINAQTGTSYTGVLSDTFKLISMSNASANTFLVPLNSAVAYPIGTELHGIQIGAGLTSIDGTTAGVTINGVTTAIALAGQYKAWTLIKQATDTWFLIGGLA